MLGALRFTKGFDLKIEPDNLIVYADFLEIPHENEIILSQKVFQANHMNIISFFCMGLLYVTHMEPIRATRIWANSYWSHMKPGCTPHMGPIMEAHIGMFDGLRYLLP